MLQLTRLQGTYFMSGCQGAVFQGTLVLGPFVQIKNLIVVLHSARLGDYGQKPLCKTMLGLYLIKPSLISADRDRVIINLKLEFQFCQKNTQNCFAYISATKYCSEAVLYSKRMAGYLLSPHIKTITVVFYKLRYSGNKDAIFWKIAKKHPIWVFGTHPWKKFSRLNLALNLYSMGIFYENKVQKMIQLLDTFTGSREHC